mmetsp:Transcript_30603/g.56112  ORF Transcript_30603/g.56112 Transcript_30603/m.56112 type:complete len:366 (+) Transcript_30603:172-1269(+)
MIPVAEVPLLALPSGSILQFLGMTLPLLAVYLYFLYLAITRPTIADPDNPQYTDDRIRLTDILYTYLATLVLFSSLVVYLLWFVNKRRRLSKRYEKEAIVILGNVEYNDSHWGSEDGTGSGSGGNFCTKLYRWMIHGCTLRNNYGEVTYNLERVANHPACNYEHRKQKSLNGIITKKVRVYYRYPREQVSILVLPEYPYSGQPKIDMEADWASFSSSVGLRSDSSRSLDVDGVDGGNYARAANTPQTSSRDRSPGVLLVAAFWIAFLLFASLYVVFQIAAVEDAYEDETARTAWIAFGCAVGGGVPLIAGGGNLLRWMVYERWILKSGTKKKVSSKKRKKKKRRSEGEENEGDDDDVEGGYIQMT